MDSKELGKRIRIAREAKNLTQDDLVERLGRNRYPSDISEYEHGKRKLAAIDIPDFAIALEVPILFFYEGVLSEDELEQAVIEWFRTLPDEKTKRRVFQFIRDTAPFIIGGETPLYPEPKPVERSLNESRPKYRKRK